MTPSRGRTPSPVDLPVALTVAGSDTTGVASSHVLPMEEIEAQYDAVTGDFDVRAAKTGMLATTEVVETVARWTREAAFPVVVDPVMVAESGDRLLTPAAEEAYEQLVAAATLVTPNADEAVVLTGIDPTTPDEQAAAGEKLVNMGAGAALVKGGHGDGETVHDTLVTPHGTETFTHPRVATADTHGSGCTLSSAVAARLAHGEELTAAVEQATGFMERAVRYAHDVGDGAGPVNHLVDLRNDARREQTREAVAGLAAQLDGIETTGVAGATPYAETAEDVLCTEDGDATFGECGLATALLSAREAAPSMRFAVETPPRFGEVASELDVPVTDHPDEDVFDGGVAAVVNDEATRFVGSDPDAVVNAVREAAEAAE
ncbi:bifunctional hydroxymethylpyrimidine kinase/phosphomethylpyrimidine kinase [Halobacteriales archaeon QS_9_67_17]|nr:MAG: bifunctional hydroxymethylpyrimidine kinase/phosphomethylpyrimidine kinase [Halobacteriales archaeon QS_9_67_17]